MTHELGRKINELLTNGILVSDDIVFSALRDKITSKECENGYILDGFPRNINQAEGYDKILEELNNYIIFSFTGNGFLKYMVRVMCGYLISVGLGKQEPGKINDYFKSKQKVTTKTAVATGLYLKDIKY